jgi:hypothetical protein
MNQKLSEIQKQLETLNRLISEYLKSSEEERIVIKKEDFGKIKHIGSVPKTDWHAFDYNNGCTFHLNGYAYAKEHFVKLMDGTLDRLIIVKRNEPYEIHNYLFNYQLEDIEKTKLFDLYGKSEM